MAKDIQKFKFKKNANNKLEAEETITEKRVTQYSKAELDNIITELQAQVTFWEAVRAEANKLAID